jgi:hypothetical protein
MNSRRLIAILPQLKKHRIKLSGLFERLNIVPAQALRETARPDAAIG